MESESSNESKDGWEFFLKEYKIKNLGGVLDKLNKLNISPASARKFSKEITEKWVNDFLNDKVSGECLEAFLTKKDLYFSNNHVSLGNSINFLDKDFTISSWIKVTGSADYMIIFAKDHSCNGGFQFRFQIGKGCLEAVITDDSTNSTWPLLITTDKIENNQWYYVSLTRKSNEFSLYINGNLKISVKTNSNFSHNVDRETRIGARLDYALSDIPDVPFEGYISCLGIWNRCLSEKEISDNIYLFRNLNETKDLIHFWDLEDDLKDKIGDVHGKEYSYFDF